MSLSSILQSLHTIPATVRAAARRVGAPVVRQLNRLDVYLSRPVEQIYSGDVQTVLDRVANDRSTEVVYSFYTGRPLYRRLRFCANGKRLPLLPTDIDNCYIPFFPL